MRTCPTGVSGAIRMTVKGTKASMSRAVRRRAMTSRGLSEVPAAHTSEVGTELPTCIALQPPSPCTPSRHAGLQAVRRTAPEGPQGHSWPARLDDRTRGGSLPGGCSVARPPATRRRWCSEQAATPSCAPRAARREQAASDVEVGAHEAQAAREEGGTLGHLAACLPHAALQAHPGPACSLEHGGLPAQGPLVTPSCAFGSWEECVLRGRCLAGQPLAGRREACPGRSSQMHGHLRGLHSAGTWRREAAGAHSMPRREQRSGTSAAMPARSSASMNSASPASTASRMDASRMSSRPKLATRSATSSLLPCLPVSQRSGAYSLRSLHPPLQHLQSPTGMPAQHRRGPAYQLKGSQVVSRPQPTPGPGNAHGQATRCRASHLLSLASSWPEAAPPAHAAAALAAASSFGGKQRRAAVHVGDVPGQQLPALWSAQTVLGDSAWAWAWLGRAGPVQGDEEDVRVVPQQGGGAVPVVHVPVQDQHASMPLLHVTPVGGLSTGCWRPCLCGSPAGEC